MSMVETADLRPASATSHHDEVPAGDVISVDPQVGTELARESTVTLTVSLGVAMVTMPEVAGMSEQQALTELVDAGFSADPAIETEYSAEVEQGQVIEASPGTGTEVEHHDEPTLVVSAGREPITIPSVVGVQEADAVAELDEAGAAVEVVGQEHSDEVAEGLVISQSQDGEALRGDEVSLVVSLGPELFEVPDVVGLSYRDAAQQLTEAGFDVAREEVLGGYFNTVRSQDIDAGAMVPGGSLITLTVV